MNILVVDDIEANRYLLRTLLSAQGYHVSEAVHGRDALESAQKSRPDLVISDILMPVMDGFALCHEWKADAKLNSIPFVFYTATYTEPKDEAFALSLGADRFLIKPMESHDFLREVLDVVKTEKSASKPAMAPTIKENEEYYRRYNTRLIHKLEEKMLQLEDANHDLRELNRTLEFKVAERTKELETANKELQFFSYSMSHDLRAPLRHISGYSEALLDEYSNNLDEKGEHYLKRLQSATSRMDKLIESLMGLAHLTQREILRGRVNLSELVTEITDRLKSNDRQDTKIVIKPGVYVTADSSLLHIALENLLDNAWKFTRNTAGARIEFRTDHKDGKTVYVIEDNGAGFNMDKADKLFTVFQRLHSNELYQGTGIGLATVYRVVTRHGGQIWGDGKEGKGAAFYFTLE